AGPARLADEVGEGRCRNGAARIFGAELVIAVGEGDDRATVAVEGHLEEVAELTVAAGARVGGAAEAAETDGGGVVWAGGGGLLAPLRVRRGGVERLHHVEVPGSEVGRRRRRQR